MHGNHRLSKLITNSQDISRQFYNESVTKKPVCVIYITGSGRSGSTVLDIVIGNHKNIFGAGELINVVKSAWINNEYCSCGEKGKTCEFWSNVRQEWENSIRSKDLEKYITLQKMFEKFGMRSLLMLIREKIHFTTQFKMYAIQTRSLFRAIHSVSGNKIIVDSSKNPIRALALSMIPGIDMHIIHLVRDGRGVTWSNKKAFKKNVKMGLQRELYAKPVWRTAAFWIVVNLLSTSVRHWISPHKSILVRYEDFVTCPSETLLKIGDLVNCDFGEVVKDIENQTGLTISHTIAGSRMRMLGRVNLKLDEEWKTKLPLIDKWLFWVFAGWLLNSYRYNTIVKPPDTNGIQK